MGITSCSRVRSFFDQIDRIAGASYQPTDGDILHARVKTTGIIESTFKIGNLVYRFVCRVPTIFGT